MRGEGMRGEGEEWWREEMREGGKDVREREKSEERRR